MQRGSSHADQPEDRFTPRQFPGGGGDDSGLYDEVEGRTTRERRVGMDRMPRCSLMVTHPTSRPRPTRS
jgi:hypothetical protein